jgi:hypothetical protein
MFSSHVFLLQTAKDESVSEVILYTIAYQIKRNNPLFLNIFYRKAKHYNGPKQCHNFLYVKSIYE